MSEIKEKNEPLNKNNKVPKLRFKEFTNEWKKTTFETSVSLSKEKYNPSKNTKSEIDLEMDSIESITGKLIAKYDSLEFKSIKNVFTGNSVLYGKLNPYLRKYYKPNFTGVCSSEFWVLNPIKITQSFLYHFVTTDNFNIQTNKTCGTSMPRADWDVIKGSNIYYPTNEEQVKIGSFLDMIDSKIRIVDSKISTLKKYKKKD